MFLKRLAAVLACGLVILNVARATCGLDELCFNCPGAQPSNNPNCFPTASPPCPTPGLACRAPPTPPAPCPLASYSYGDLCLEDRDGDRDHGEKDGAQGGGKGDTHGGGNGGGRGGGG
jgi:hypothetical protein